MLLMIIFVAYAILRVQDVSTLAIYKRQEPNESSNFWISAQPMDDKQALEVLAVIIKDEDLNENCTVGDDIRYSKKRYFMCFGSILSKNLILTSANCIHDVMYVRHNINAPLAVFIAPFSDTAQIIKVLNWYIHPDHTVNPNDLKHKDHNLAVLRLSCSIHDENFKPIEFPDKPRRHECEKSNEKKCTSFVIKPLNMFPQSNLEVYQYQALENTDTTTILPDSHCRRAARTIVDNKNQIGKIKFINKRETSGLEGCPGTGAPVMMKNVQSALIARGCDDRHLFESPIYTDLFDNLDWLNKIKDLPDLTLTTTTTTTSKPGLSFASGCNNCVYNIFVNCNGTSCVNEKTNSEVKVPGLIDANAENCTESKNTTNFESPYEDAEHRREFLKDIDKLYRNNSVKSDEIAKDDDIGEPIAKRLFNSEITSLKPRLQLQSSTTNRIKEGFPYRHVDYDYDDFLSDYDYDLYKLKTNEKSIGTGPLKNKNKNVISEKEPRKNLSMKKYFDDNKYERTGFPKEYRGLYETFMKEYMNQNP